MTLPKPVNATLFSGHEALHVLNNWMAHELDVSTDLGLSTMKCIGSETGVLIGNKTLRWNVFEKMAKRLEDVYLLNKKIRRLAWFDRSFYRLVAPVFRKSPTVEIDGIRMHRTVNITPLEDARIKISLFPDLAGATVLDICTGLGYTALLEAEKGASSVVTVEKDVNVLKMAAFNPWSKPLFQNKIEIVLDDAETFLKRCEQTFDYVMHDPPTVKIAGDLYSMSFYKLIHKVMRKGGVLVHYVGQPGVRKGVSFYRGVMERLRKAGFKPEFVPEAVCVKAVKV